MRVLQLCHKRPFPPADGGSIAMHQIAWGLIEKGHQVKVIALDSPKNNLTRKNLPQDYLQNTAFEALDLDTRVKILPAFFNLFTRKSYNVERFFSPQMERRLEQVLQEQTFDIIQLEGLYLTPYLKVIRKFSTAPVIYRAHNIEHFIWQRLAAATSHPLKKKYMKLLAFRLKEYEMKIIHQVDGLVAISRLDQEFFQNNGFGKPAITIPVGIPQLRFSSRGMQPVADSVYHIGSMDWRPNQEGIEWFLEKVWPRVERQNPGAKFFLAGKNTPQRFFRYASSQVQVKGEVPDAAEFFMPLELMVVPLLSAGGMRVKIIEGMAAGKTIISTTIGAEGIGCKNGEHILLADNPTDMADAILQCLQNKEKARQIGLNAREFVNSYYSIDSIIQNLITFYKGFVHKKL